MNTVGPEQIMTVHEILILIAIVSGPVIAVFITRSLDNRRERRNRRWQIFSSLMGTRRARLSREYVNALNLVEIEFHGHEGVMKEWKSLMVLLCGNPIDPDNTDAIRNWMADVDKRLASLLHQMSSSLGLEIQQLDIFGGGYSPIAWAKQENEQKEMLNLMAELFKVAKEKNLRELAEAGDSKGPLIDNNSE